MWSDARPPTAAQVLDSFGVEVDTLRSHPGGFEADAFTDGRWFVKLWRWEADSDAALALTAELAARGVPVPAAQRARDGSHTSHQDGRRYALFPFVEGRSGTWDDADAIAQSMRAVHEIADLALPNDPAVVCGELDPPIVLGASTPTPLAPLRPAESVPCPTSSVMVTAPG